MAGTAGSGKYSGFREWPAKKRGLAAKPFRAARNILTGPYEVKARATHAKQLFFMEKRAIATIRPA